MFFVLSKLFWFVAQPINLATILVVVALAFGWLKWRRLAAWSAFSSALILVVCVWTSFGAMIISPLENRFPKPDLPDNITGIVVLGGGLEGQINLARGGYEMNASGDRFVEAAVLARRFPQARILISGGNGSLLLDGEGDAATSERLLTALGVDRTRLTLENESRNTYENANFSKALVDPKPGETWLLVTSAFHMPRSIGLFRKAGFDVRPWPVDYRTSGLEGVGLFKDNAQDSLATSTMALREWIGLVAYWLSGRIDSPFPAP